MRSSYDPTSNQSSYLNAPIRSIYDIDLNAADGSPKFLEQYKGKVTMIVNTTVGCGNANQLEVLQKIQAKYGPDKFEIVAIPTNDYCGPGVTKGKWSEGITCGADSEAYGKDVYKTTFKYSEMVSSLPNETVGQQNGKNGLGQEFKLPHEMYLEIQLQNRVLREKNRSMGIVYPVDDYYSWWLNYGFDGGEYMGGNYEKYLVDKDGYVVKHYQCTVLNYDIEKTLKDSLIEQGIKPTLGLGRSQKIFDEEFEVVCKDIEDLINGKKSVINPSFQ